MSSQTVLFVDDVPANPHPYELYLERSIPCTVVRARSGAEALKATRGQRVDLILLDIMMVPMDGFRTCELLRKRRRLDGVPIVILTRRLAGGEDETRAMRVGADAYIHKPISSRALAEVVGRYLANGRKLHQTKG
jgi:CheY-like chemotaxis protein